MDEEAAHVEKAREEAERVAANGPPGDPVAEFEAEKAETPGPNFQIDIRDESSQTVVEHSMLAEFVVNTRKEVAQAKVLWRLAVEGVMPEIPGQHARHPNQLREDYVKARGRLDLLLKMFLATETEALPAPSAIEVPKGGLAVPGVSPIR